MSEETTIFRGSPSILIKGGQVFVAILLILAGAIGAIMLHQFMIPFAILAGIGLLWLIGLIIAVRAWVYEVTTQRVLLTRGILSKRTDTLELYRVTDLALVEPFLLRVLGKGTVELVTSDPTTPVLRVEAIAGAREIREALRTAVEECRDRKRVRVTEFE
jgi:uncharacterized membrane protein YdbT with pleckstrin-like domain